MAHATQCKSQRRFSLVGIDKPHKTKLLVQSVSTAASNPVSPPLLSSSHLASQARAVHISNQHDRQWKLFISGSGLVADCLSIHTNKGQRSHDEADKASLTHAHKHTHTLVRTDIQQHFSKSLLFLNLWPLKQLRFTKHFQTDLSNGPLLKQSAECSDQDDWSPTSGSMQSHESLDQLRWREKREGDGTLMVSKGN